MPFDNSGTYEIARVITMIWPLCLRQRRDVPRRYVRNDRCGREGRGIRPDRSPRFVSTNVLTNEFKRLLLTMRGKRSNFLEQ